MHKAKLVRIVEGLKEWKKEEMKYVNLQTLVDTVNKALARREK
jgi:hypothetical protein